MIRYGEGVDQHTYYGKVAQKWDVDQTKQFRYISKNNRLTAALSFNRSKVKTGERWNSSTFKGE
jgi:hypothetical protein